MVPVSGVSVGGADASGEGDGLLLGSAEGEVEGEGVPPLGTGVEAGDEQAAMTMSTTRQRGTRMRRRIGLVGVEADVGCLDGRERSVAEQA